MAEGGDGRGSEDRNLEEPILVPAKRVDTGAVAPDPSAGDVVAGYALLELLGKGGAGSVFKARREADGEIVALKVLAASKVKRARIVQRFFDEVRAASSVDHPGLIRVFDFIEEEHPRRLAYVMEYVQGEALRARIKREGALDLRTSIQIAIQICDALTSLHEHGIIHRDLKPENILIIDVPGRAEPRVKLLDFGVVKFLPVDRTQPSRTDEEKPGTFVGTPRYMAPEQAAGATVDMRADLFSIGVMLFEMITGRCPHEGDSLRDVVLAKLKGAPRITMNPEKEILPQELTEIVDACLQLKPALRPERAFRVANALREADMVLFAVGPIRAGQARAEAERAEKARVEASRAASLRAQPPTPPPAVRPREPVDTADTPPLGVSEPPALAPAAASGPSNRLVWLLVAVCVLAALALVAVWQIRKSQAAPVFMLNPEKSRAAPKGEVEPTNTSTTP